MNMESLHTARVVPIAELCPDLPDPSTTAVGGVVTITWPYNKVHGTFAFSLAEPDFRLRRNKGQARIDFRGRAAQAVGGSDLGSNDEVLLSLAGATWEAETANKRRSLPGADLGWKLIFSERVSLKIKRAETGNIDFVVVDEQPNQHRTPSETAGIQSPTVTKSQSPPAALSPSPITSPVREIGSRGLNDGEFASPAFVKRARMSYGSLFEDGFDIFQDDGGVVGKGRKRTKFGRDSSAWRYTSQSPSPERDAVSPLSAHEHLSSPTRVASTPSKVAMTDEGCQTMEVDRSSPQPTSNLLPSNSDTTVPRHISANDAPLNTLTSPLVKQSAPPSNGHSLESRVREASAPVSSIVPCTDSDAPLQQQHSLSRNMFAGAQWNEGVTLSTFEQEQKAPFPPLHLDASFVPSGFENSKPGSQPIPFNASHDLGGPYPGGCDNQSDHQDAVNDSLIYSAEPNSSAFSYPSLDSTENTHSQPFHDEALTHYPASYLEGRTYLADQTIGEQTPHQPAVAEVGPTSWATVNHNSNATAKPPTDRLGSEDGNSPEQALLVNESGSDTDSGPEPIAIEDTVNNGRAYALGMYEDAEAEDEVDAQYSDDDEPEYDADEMGGDYDTRNYEQPDDDDDDDHDEDLRSHPLDPEFNDGESWDEEEQEEFLAEEDEGEYEMTADVAESNPQPVVRANPTVIDLISSSEDESESGDEGEDDEATTKFQRSGAHIDSRTLPSHHPTVSDDSPEALTDDEESDIISQAEISEADSSSSIGAADHEYASSLEEEEGGGGERANENKDKSEFDRGAAAAQEEGMDAETAQETSVQEDVYTFESSSGQAQQSTEPKTKSARELEPSEDAILGDLHYQNAEPSTAKKSGAETPQNTRDGTEQDIREQRSGTIPLSAADGLDMLSRAVDKESIANSHRESAQYTVEWIPIDAITDELSPAEPAAKDNVRGRHSPSKNNDQSMADEEMQAQTPIQSNGPIPADLLAPSNPGIEHQSFSNQDGGLAYAAPASPPLTHSYQSRIEGHASPTPEGTPSEPGAQVPAAHLPTPLNSQTTDIALNATISTSMAMAESFHSHATTEPQVSETAEGFIFEKTVAQQEISMATNLDSMNEEYYNGVITGFEVHQTSHEPHAALSPAVSFQSQVEGELAEPSNAEQRKTETDSCLPRSPSPQPETSGTDTNRYLASQMEIDDELQASILEHSQLEELVVDHTSNSEDDKSRQVNTDEAYAEAEQTEDEDIASPSLLDYTPAKQLADEISAHIWRGVTANDSSEEVLESSSSMRNDPSVDLARLGNALKDTDGGRAARSPPQHPSPQALDSADEIFAQLMHDSIAYNSSGDDSDTSSMRNDHSVHMARLANTYNDAEKEHGASSPLRPSPSAIDAHPSATPEADDWSLQNARASLASQTSRSEEDSYSMTACKLQLARHRRDELPDCVSLRGLRRHLTRSLDVIAVAVMEPPEPQRAKRGPREFMMSFTISDCSIGPYDVVEAMIYRPYKETLPIVKRGDILLLRNFTVVSLAKKGFGLRSNDESSWAVFDHEGEPPQIRGPPVECSNSETLYVNYLREWFGLLDHKAMRKLERANQEIINAGRSK
ncbi:hypothetical protein F4802DRAFT_550297 [Xylaria palmicola]|nr:hypothetical protein F4802DRAFT_550297 [Xylaria palmicola]